MIASSSRKRSLVSAEVQELCSGMAEMKEKFRIYDCTDLKRVKGDIYPESLARIYCNSCSVHSVTPNDIGLSRLPMQVFLSHPVLKLSHNMLSGRGPVKHVPLGKGRNMFLTLLLLQCP